LYWGTDGVSYASLAMIPGAGDSYSRSIPGQSQPTTVYYYIEVVDTDAIVNTVTHPTGAPTANHSFLVDEDLEDPTIVHSPHLDTVSLAPYPIVATITDNLELNSAQIFVHYNTDGGVVYTPIPMTNIGGDEFSASIPGQSIGTTIYYYISAEDTSAAQNTGFHPVGAPGTRHQFTITDTRSLLIVDAENSGLIGNYTVALDNIGLSYDVGTSVSHNISFYRNVIWIEDNDGPDAEERVNITAFLSGGGNMYINGEDIGSKADTYQWLDWYHENLRARFVRDNSLIDMIDGISGDPITDGMANLPLTDSEPDVLTAYDSTASAIFEYDDDFILAGLKADTGT
ncbi:MAG: hypothetical protein KAT70_03970, partial [Thermoplasmata archaeon]|nr:hypothetical protein [Thermoplasmata archaeon]